MSSEKRPVYLWLIAVVAMAFGALTIKSGGAVLFFDGAARAAAGNYVGFVLWFNFIAGFAYIIAGVGLLLRKGCAAKLAAAIAAATLLVFALFGLYILNGGAFEMRTVIAMTLRSVVWLTIALLAWRWARSLTTSQPSS
ncbi:MAG: hypothetical protein OQL08_12535 [Gammaproteobacteria bacterium]|nr:hypothetical protein [Gammaproteobacteria bacterium]